MSNTFAEAYAEFLSKNDIAVFKGLSLAFDMAAHIARVAAEQVEGKNPVAPPLGITPRFIIDEHRIQEIAEAIVRFLAADKDIPKEWIEEYIEIKNRLEARENK